MNKTVTIGSPEKSHCENMGLSAPPGGCGDCDCITSLEASTNVAIKTAGPLAIEICRATPNEFQTFTRGRQSREALIAACKNEKVADLESTT